MVSKGSELSCKACGSSWQLDEYGRLIDVHGKTLHIPDWYEWERQQVIQEIEHGKYTLDIKVQVEALPNEKGFVKLGSGRLTHDKEKYVLTLDAPDPSISLADSFPLIIQNRNLESTQTEYNYRGRGKCIVLSTRDCCYYIYSENPNFCVTKLQFAVEYLNGGYSTLSKK